MPISASIRSRLAAAGLGALLEAHVHAVVGAAEHARLAHADVGLAGHAHVVGHGDPHVADAQIDLERRVARGQLEVAQVEVELAQPSS